MDVVSKGTGDSYTAAEFNQSNNELENLITDTGISLASGDLFQLSKAVANYVAQGDFYVDSGAADAYVLGALGSKQAPTSYADGMRVRFEVGNINTGASTINVAGLGVKNIKTPSGIDPAAGDLDGSITLQYDLANGYFIIYDVATGGATNTPSIRDIARNLVIINTVANPTFQMDIDADEVLLQSPAGAPFKALSVNETVDITAGVGAGGIDAGSEASSTWYFLWLIAKADGTVDAILSLSSSAPALPAGYIYQALVGAVYNDSGSDFIDLFQTDNKVVRQEVNVLSGGTATTFSSVSLATAVPTTAKTALISGIALNSTGAGADLTVGIASKSTEEGKITTEENAVANGDGGCGNWFRPSIIESQTIYYKAASATRPVTLDLSGWEY